MSRSVTSLEGYLRVLGKLKPRADERMLYRGHSSRDYALLPSVLREDRLRNAEHAMLQELISDYPREFSDDSTTMEQLARAQHYMLPTRLLGMRSFWGVFPFCSGFAKSFS